MLNLVVHTETTGFEWLTYVIHKYIPYRAVNNRRLCYTNQSVNVV